MGTYSPKKIITDWSNGTLTPEMAMGQALQHIAELYERQATADNERRKLQAQVSQLENKLKTTQAILDRLVSSMSGESKPKQERHSA